VFCRVPCGRADGGYYVSLALDRNEFRRKPGTVPDNLREVQPTAFLGAQDLGKILFRNHHRVEGRDRAPELDVPQRARDRQSCDGVQAAGDTPPLLLRLANAPPMAVFRNIRACSGSTVAAGFMVRRQCAGFDPLVSRARLDMREVYGRPRIAGSRPSCRPSASARLGRQAAPWARLRFHRGEILIRGDFLFMVI